MAETTAPPLDPSEKALIAALRAGDFQWQFVTDEHVIRIAGMQADALRGILAAAYAVDFPAALRAASEPSLLERWRKASREATAAYRRWDDACNSPGKVGAIEARFNLQEAMTRLRALELEMLSAAPVASLPDAAAGERELQAWLSDIWRIAHLRALPANVQSELETAVARIRKLLAPSESITDQTGGPLTPWGRCNACRKPLDEGDLFTHCATCAAEIDARYQ